MLIFFSILWVLNTFQSNLNTINTHQTYANIVDLACCRFKGAWHSPMA